MLTQPPTHGAYGLRITGLSDAERHLHRVPSEWPELNVQLAEARDGAEVRPPGTIRIGELDAELWLAEAGCIELKREPLQVTFATRAPLTPDAILHPFLGLPATIAGRWLGRISLHGGAFIRSGRALALLGKREAGKSATLARLLGAGHQVLSDDVLVVSGTTLFAGPRSIDLREEAAADVGGDPLGVVGNRERWRLRPDEGPPAVELAGLIVLDWGERLALEPLGAEARLRQLIDSSALVPDESCATALLELSALPAWRFTRPRRASGVASSVEWLLERLPEL